LQYYFSTLLPTAACLKEKKESTYRNQFQGNSQARLQYIYEIMALQGCGILNHLFPLVNCTLEHDLLR